MNNSEIVQAQVEPIGEQKPKMSGRQRLFVGIIAVVMLLLGGGIAIVTTMQVTKLRDEGINYYTLVPGSPGINGKSAYQLAVDNGYRGTEDEWLRTLRGTSGEDGQPGLSAFQLAQVQGYLGSQTEWLNSLVGDRGKSAYDIARDNGFSGTQLDWLASLVGARGADGISITGNTGATGATGATGQSGASAYAIAVINGFNGTEQQWLDSLRGANGLDAQPMMMNCVIRTVNTLPVQYTSWKYANEADSAYRDLYRMPTWAEGKNCVDLTGTP